MAREDTQFKPGVSGNPKGRPKKAVSITDAVRSYMAEHDLVQGEKKERLETLVKVIWKAALSGDLAAIRLIWNYLDGMPKQNISIEDIQKNPLLEKLSNYENSNNTIDDDNNDTSDI